MKNYSSKQNPDVTSRDVDSQSGAHSNIMIIENFPKPNELRRADKAKSFTRSKLGDRPQMPKVFQTKKE